jgi:hypothetical protein
MRHLSKGFWKILTSGGWAPLLVFAIHVFIGRVLGLYESFPPIDIPMHISGGLAIAFFISTCFQNLPREALQRDRIAILELLLAGTLTVTAAVFWEFAEFSVDQLFGSNVQVSLANTMKDMALGITGALAYIIIRSRQLRVGLPEVQKLTTDWVTG